MPANGSTPSEGSGDTAKEVVSATDALEGHNILLNPPDRNPSTAFQRIHHLSSPVAVDIGGTLAKMAYFRPSNPIPRFVVITCGCLNSKMFVLQESASLLYRSRKSFLYCGAAPSKARQVFGDRFVQYELCSSH